MLNPDTRPSSIEGIKRLATQIKKTVGIPHHEALDLASRAASFQSFPLAHKALVRPAEGYPRFQLFLTFYWTDRETYRRGRETLEIWLSQPLLDLCSKAEMKMVSGLANMRLVAPDHLVTDMMGQSQEFARGQILKSVRALRFMEATGLRPCDHEPSRKAKASLSEELPDHDHDSDWYDPVSGHYVMIDEPYSRPVVSSERAAWARVNGWHIEAARWPGIYFPHRCAFFVAANANAGFDFSALMDRINAIPVITDNWFGISARGHALFVSPTAQTPQGRRRAKAKALVVARPSKTTTPYFGMWGHAKRRPNGTPGLEAHQVMGRMIKAVLHSRHKPWAVNRRMDKVRSTLEDWLNYELEQGDLDGPEFFDVYYNDLPDGDPFELLGQSSEGVAYLLLELKRKLESVYPICAPRAAMMSRIDVSVRIVCDDFAHESPSFRGEPSLRRDERTG